jgi:hypothetical protein
MRLGRKVFCSLHCFGKINAKLHPMKNPNRVPPVKTTDALSPFRHYHKTLRSRIKWYRKIKKGRFILFNKDPRRQLMVTVEDLKNQWDKQKGICPYTGILLKIPRSAYGWEKIPKNFLRASIDRIDSSKGYTKDNIQFISLMANYAKHEFDDSELIKFCQAVSKYHPETIS